MEQLILHLVGDYITQSHRMANEKTKDTLWAILHAWIYGLPFFLLGGWRAVGIIVVTHFLIDRYRLVRYVIFAKNWVNDTSLRWSDCSGTGYHKDVPPWLSVWLMIVADNTIHLLLNFLAIKLL